MSWSLGISSGVCTGRPILEVLDALAGCGARGLELGTPPRHFDPGQASQVTALGRRLRELALTAVSIHAPFGGVLDLAEPGPQHRDAAIDAILGAGRALKRLGGSLVVVHPSDLPRQGADVDARIRDCQESLARLGEGLAHDQLRLVVESPLPHIIGGHPDEFARILQPLDRRVGVCLDTGHTALGRHWHRFLEVSGSRLIHVHASDNHGRFDDHLPPGEGHIDWHDIRDSLRRAAFEGWVMVELGCPIGDLAEYLARAMARATSLLDGG
jgi:sugar phosphate isomerase/epimerase